MDTNTRRFIATHMVFLYDQITKTIDSEWFVECPDFRSSFFEWICDLVADMVHENIVTTEDIEGVSPSGIACFFEDMAYDLNAKIEHELRLDRQYTSRLF